MGDYDYEKQKLKKQQHLQRSYPQFCSDSVRQQSGRFFFKSRKSDTVYRTLQEIKEDETINIGVFLIKSFGYVDEMEHIRGMMYICEPDRGGSRGRC